MKRCAFLTIDDLTEYVNDDQLALDQLAHNGWDARSISWHSKDVDWDAFDLVIVRSTWDYYEAPERFVDVLGQIDASSARLENALDIIVWNLDKTYLKDLQGKGIPVVPTRWGSRLTASGWQDILDQHSSTSFIIKPVISANAKDTFLVNTSRDVSQHQRILQTFAEKKYMVQPFVKSIVEEGEYSLFFFNGAYSHSILKTPKTNDFRVQEEHGGRIVAVHPHSTLIEQALEILQTLPTPLLYARVDLVRIESGDYALMELELIEPSLYLRMDPEAPERFARAIDSLN